MVNHPEFKEYWLAGHRVAHFTQTDSTNNRLSELVEKGQAENGLIVRADYQFAGKGQRDSDWQSEACKNLLISELFVPTTMMAQEQFNISKAVSISIVKSIREIVPEIDIKIKWPNDIHSGTKKVCGTLISCSLKGNSIQSAVIGIGLNVNQTNFNGIENAGSLLTETGKEVNIEALFKSLLRHLDQGLQLAEKRNFNELEKLYLKNLWGLDESNLFKSGDLEFEGVIVGVADDGKLRVETNGKINQYDLKEISPVLVR